ncbi:MAG: general secretion pathway protein GspK [Pirellulales bacterium]|nr:general secretion pathway protein GspK [Pirellulales bacterium]
MVLILVLVVIAALSLAAMTFSEWMFTERQAAVVSGRQAEARALAESGVEAVRQFLSTDPQTAVDAGGWYDNPGVFCGVVVLDGDQARDRGRFTVISRATDLGEYSGTRYGVEDESAKLNLNTLMLIEKRSAGAARSLLMGLPGMTEDIADAILDWLDEDDEPREFGAEVESYSGLDPPYAPKNAPLAVIDELLMVRGVTPELLFGVDTNRNGYADDTESAPSMLEGVDPSSGPMDCGWSAYLTLHSLEANVQPDGQPKIDVNHDDLQALATSLEEAMEPEWAKYILAYRQQQQSNSQQQGNNQAGQQQSGPTAPSNGPGNPQGPNNSSLNRQDDNPSPQNTNQNEQNTARPSQAGSGELDLSQPGNTKLTSVLDLIDSKIQVKFQGQQQAVEVECPFKSETAGEYLPKLMDVLATDTSKTIAGRLNINEAPGALLAAIPGMPTEAVDAILSKRQAAADSGSNDLRHATWLLTEGIVNLEQMKQLLPLVTGGGSVYRAQVVGFFDRDGPAARIEAVFDATQRPARIVSWRELTALGRGYPLDVLGAETGSE